MIYLNTALLLDMKVIFGNAVNIFPFLKLRIIKFKYNELTGFC